MGKLKIGIVCPYDYTRFGGVQEHIRFVADEMRARGHSVKVIAPTPAKKPQNSPRDVIFIGSSTAINTPMATTAELTVSATPREIDTMFQEERFDIVHFHEPWVPVLSRQLLTRSHASNIATFHAKLPETWVNKSIERAWRPYGKNLMRYVDAITAVSSAAAEYVSTATHANVQIIPNGIDLSVFNRQHCETYRDYDDNIKTILYIGRLEKRKGVEYLLKGYRALREKHDDVRLVIVGDGPRRKSLKAWVTRYRVPDVKFLGFVDEDDKCRLLKTADVFCSPAIYGESFGIVLLEAMAMGAPVVAGSNPGYASVMQDVGRIGLVDPRSTQDMAYKLESMLYVPAIREFFTEWADEYVKQFDYQNVADQYEQLYQRVKGH